MDSKVNTVIENLPNDNFWYINCAHKLGIYTNTSSSDETFEIGTISEDELPF